MHGELCCEMADIEGFINAIDTTVGQSDGVRPQFPSIVG